MGQPERPMRPLNIEHFGFLLLPELSIYGLIPAIEALRIANQNSGRKLYSWTLISADGQPLRASSGMALAPDAAIAEIDRVPAIIVCAGNHPLQHIDRRILQWLARQERYGAMVGAIDSGSFVLAEAGLLNGYRATVHWEVLELFRDRYPDVEVSEELFVIDRSRFTCAGGIAALDLMLHFIAEQHGTSLAQVVANGFVHGRRRLPHEPQLLQPHSQHGVHDHRLDRLIKTMEENLENHLAPAELAARSHLSLRQMERLVRQLLDDSPMRLYLKIRLDAARVHLFHGKLSVKEIALACGFSSSPVFCRAFRTQFGMSPLEFRRRYSTDALARFRSGK